MGGWHAARSNRVCLRPAVALGSLCCDSQSVGAGLSCHDGEPVLMTVGLSAVTACYDSGPIVMLQPCVAL